MSIKYLFFLLAILCGFFTALSDVLSKLFMRKYNVDSFFTLFVRSFIASILLTPMLFLGRKENVEFHHILLYIFGIPVEVIAGYLYLRSLELAEASFILPFQAITPVLIPAVSFALIGERYSYTGILGVLLVTVGTIFILRSVGRVEKEQNQMGQKNIRGGIVIAGNVKKAVLFMSCSAIIYAFTSVLGRYMVLEIDPIFFMSSYFISFSLALFLIFSRRYGLSGLIMMGRTWSMALWTGLTMFLAVITHFFAMYGIETAYMISLKRTSVLFSVLLGYVMLGEEGFKMRFTGALFMFLGVIIISISL